ncbi:hypothetical protein [Deinococcus alpinitundrae]|uniref:hypothetical protein n=1 Tax=Deinococcus alpinitundrae TaxID=468913 RepID=UPI00137B9203|nr:hypothetical protein [Deinococcus alpinitundrae]
MNRYALVSTAFLRRTRWPAALLGACLGGAALAAYDSEAAIRTVTLQATTLGAQTKPLASSRLAALLPARCAGAAATAPRQAAAHAEAHYGSLQLSLDDFGANAMNTVMGAAQFLGLSAADRQSELVQSISGAVGYTTYDPQRRLAQTRVWLDGRFVVQIIQTSATSHAAVDACLKLIRLSALPVRRVP